MGKKKLHLLFFRLHRARNQVTVICKPKNWKNNCNIGRDKGLFILKDLEEYDLGKTVAGKFKKNFQKTSPVDTKAFQTCRHLETEHLGPEMIITRILVTSY